MANPIYQQGEELLLNQFGSKYLGVAAHTNVNSNEFIVQEDAVISVLTGGDSSTAANNVDYKASMSLSGVTLKQGALIVAPQGESFQSMTIDSGTIMAYNSVLGGTKPGYEFENALEFDGSAQYNIFSSPIITGNDYVISIWFNVAAFGKVMLTDTSTGVNFIQVNSTDIRIRTGANDRTFTVPLLSLNTWYLLNVSVVSGVARVYIDSVESSSGSQTLLSWNLRAISGYPNAAFYYDGIVDDFLFTTADTFSISKGDELLEPKDPLLVFPNAKRLYRFNSTGSSTTAIDDGSDGVNGALVGFSTPPDYWVPHTDGVNDPILAFNPINVWDSEHLSIVGTTTTATDYNNVGTKYDLVNPAISNQPTLNSSDATFNGLPSLVFDGTSDYLINNISDWRSADASGFFAFVFSTVAGTQNNVITTTDSTSNSKYVHNVINTNSLRFTVRNDAAGFTSSFRGSDVINDTNAHVCIYGSKGSTYFINIDGVNQTLTTISGTDNGKWLDEVASRDNISMGAALINGGNLFGNIKIAFSAYFPYSNQTHVSNIASYLMTKYGI